MYISDMKLYVRMQLATSLRNIKDNYYPEDMFLGVQLDRLQSELQRATSLVIMLKTLEQVELRRGDR